MDHAAPLIANHRTYGTAGPWITLLHGGPGAPGHLEPLARDLAPEFRVLEPFEREAGDVALSVDLHVRDLDTVCRQVVGQEPTAVLGFSSGAVTALAFAARHPGRVTGVVLVGSATFDPAARAEFRRRLEARLDGQARERLARADRLPAGQERATERYRAVLPFYLVDPLALPADLRVDAIGHEQTWRDMLRLQESGAHPQGFAAIRCPVLMLHGRDDPHPGRSIRDSLRAVMPQLEYVEFERCGHYPWLERGARDAFLETLTTWLRTPAGPVPPAP